MLVALTGATGFVGSHCLRRFVSDGHRVRALARSEAKLRGLFPEAVLPEGALEIVEGDMTDPDSGRRLIEGVDAVVHTAATVAFLPGRIDTMHADNLAGVENVVGAAVREGVESVVHISSVSALFRPEAPPIAVDAPLAHPKSPYGRAKSDCEVLVRRLAEESAGRLAIVYPPGILGPQDPTGSETMGAMLIYVRDWVPATTSGMNLVDVRDVADLVARIVYGAEEGRFLMAGTAVTWDEVAENIATVTGRRVKRRTLPPRLIRGAGWVCDRLKAVAPFSFPLTYETMTYATRWPGVIESPNVAGLGHIARPIAETFGDVIRWFEAEDMIGKDARGALPDWVPPEF